jgi:hypothetical protein
METRILLQRAVVNIIGGSSSSSISCEVSSSSKDDVQKSCDVLLTKLLDARRKLIGTDISSSTENSYATMIEEDTTDDGNRDSDDGADDDDAPNSPGRLLQTTLKNEYDQCRDEWESVLNRRHRDLKLQSGGLTAKMMSKKQSNGGSSSFHVMDASFWQQVESVRDYEDMRRRSSSLPSSGSSFDDSKIYQQLLKDFVSQSSAMTGNGALAAASERLQSSTSNNNKKNKSSTKKDKVDRRASKGRKLRFTEIPKLVNFTFPLSRGSTGAGSSSTTTMNFLNQDEYFQSLFGGSAR